jgi:hypothetical protein
MQIIGPLPNVAQNQIQSKDLHLRLNQRFNADIVEVSSTQVILSVDGHTIVARLEPGEQLLDLMNRRSAQFIVTALSEGEVVLKLAQASPQATGSSAAGPDSSILARILEQAGVAPGAENMLIARALLNQRMLVTQSSIEELGRFLATMGDWTEADARLAAGIRASGLPLTPGSFQLAASQSEQISEALLNLQQILGQAVNNPRIRPELQELISRSLHTLDMASINWAVSKEGLAEALNQAVKVFGRSFENWLYGQFEGMTPEPFEMANLAHLFDRIKGGGQNALANELRSFLETLQQNHLMNVRPSPVPGHGDWLELGFVVQDPQTKEAYPARFRVSARRKPHGKAVDPSGTRLVVQVDLNARETMQVDISLVGKQIQAHVNAPDGELSQLSEEELPALEQGLRNLGYLVSSARVANNKPDAPRRISSPAALNWVLRSINLKV